MQAAAATDKFSQQQQQQQQQQQLSASAIKTQARSSSNTPHTQVRDVGPLHISQVHIIAA
jgi:hypothetical protein